MFDASRVWAIVPEEGADGQWIYNHAESAADRAHHVASAPGPVGSSADATTSRKRQHFLCGDEGQELRAADEGLNRRMMQCAHTCMTRAGRVMSPLGCWHEAAMHPAVVVVMKRTYGC